MYNYLLADGMKRALLGFCSVVDDFAVMTTERGELRLYLCSQVLMNALRKMGLVSHTSKQWKTSYEKYIDPRYLGITKDDWEGIIQQIVDFRSSVCFCYVFLFFFVCVCMCLFTLFI